MERVQSEHGVSERRACQGPGPDRTTQRKVLHTADDEAGLTADIIELARVCGRYGYRQIMALLHKAGWAVNAKRGQRIWRRQL